jgi:hypothetical protein
MLRGKLQSAGGSARSPSSRTILMIGLTGLALLTYCDVQKDINSNPTAEFLAPATMPSADSSGPTAVYILAAGSEVILQGTTSVGSWSSRSSQALARIVLDADGSAVPTLFDNLQAGKISADQLRIFPARLAKAELSVPVMSLQGDSQGMDGDMQSALKAAQYPSIKYQLEKVQDAQVRQDPKTGKPELLLNVVGALSIAGVQRKFVSDLTIQRDARGHYLVAAQNPILMTDFGVAAPTALFGLIRARDSLSVIFHLDFNQDMPSTNPSGR